MIPADETEFGKVLMGLSSIKPGNKLTPEGIEIFWAAMQDWTLHDFKIAAAQLALSVEFMPSPYHFDQLRKAGEQTAGEAWIRARLNSRTAIVCGHATAGQSCGDELIDRTVAAIGGYGAIAMCESSKLGFLEHRFAKHYADLQEVHRTREALPQITGNVERIRALVRDLPRVGTSRK